MTTSAANPERLLELLADRATQGLPDSEQRELAELLGPDPDDDTSFDWAAAAVDLPVILADDEPIPASLRARVEADGVEWLAKTKGMTLTANASAAEAGISRHLAWLPWLAAAAGLLLALTAWWPSRTPDVVALRAALEAEPETRVIAWTDAAGAGVTGDVIWNNRTQQGYLRFRGLAANDPEAMQYQLWIFDNARASYSANTAVDGGVFDVTDASGDIIVPIDAKLDVFEPSLFAVTTEPPGGVVVHQDDPEKGYAIILTAAPDG